MPSLIEHTVDVTVTFPVTIPVMEGIENQRIAFMLEDYLRHWNDGRYPFTVEQLKDAMRGCVKNALYKTVEEREVKKHNGEYVDYLNSAREVTGKTAKFVLTTDEAMRNVRPYVREEISVSVSERPRGVRVPHQS